MEGSLTPSVEDVKIDKLQCFLGKLPSKNLAINDLDRHNNVLSFSVDADSQSVLGDYFVLFEYVKPNGKKYSVKRYAFTLIDDNIFQTEDISPEVPPTVFVQANIAVGTLIPEIGENGNWWVGGIDTGVNAEGSDGIGVSSIVINEAGDLIVTYSNGTTQNAGSVLVDGVVTEDMLSIAIARVQVQITQNTTAIDNIGIEVAALRETVNERTHFRGTYQLTSSILAISDPREGDYAYNLETLTQWNYEGGIWSDTGDALPTGLISLSDTEPLADGVASPGTANEAARGDHRHPTDNTKQDVLTPGSNISIEDNIISAALPKLQTTGVQFANSVSESATEDGTLSSPYRTFGTLANAVSFGTGYLFPGTYTGDALFSPNHATLSGLCDRESYRIELSGNITINTPISSSLTNLEIDGDLVVNMVPGSLIYFNNIAINGNVVLNGTGGYAQFAQGCQFMDSISVNGSVGARFIDCQCENNSVLTTNTSAQVEIHFCRNFTLNRENGYIDSQGTRFIVRESFNPTYPIVAPNGGAGTMVFSTGECWNLNLLTGLVSLAPVSMGAGTIYGLGFQYEPASSQLLGTEIDIASAHSNQIYDHNLYSSWESQMSGKSRTLENILKSINYFMGEFTLNNLNEGFASVILGDLRLVVSRSGTTTAGAILASNIFDDVVADVRRISFYDANTPEGQYWDGATFTTAGTSVDSTIYTNTRDGVFLHIASEKWTGIVIISISGNGDRCRIWRQRWN